MEGEFGEGFGKEDFNRKDDYSEGDVTESQMYSAPKESSKKEEIIIEAKNFFDSYKKEVGESLRKGENVIYINFQKLNEFSNKLAEEILISPENTLELIETAIEESGLVSNVRVRLYNLPKSQEIKIRNIRSKNLNELIVIEGIIRQSSDVRPKVVNAKFSCPSCGTVLSVLQMESKFKEPSRCSCGRRGGFTVISKEMIDMQRIVIEESPDSLLGGEQPKRLNIFVKEDLVEPRMEEKTTPGSRIKIIGVLKEVPTPLNTGGISTRFELSVDANNIIPMEETFEDLEISEEDEKQILELSQDPKLFEKLAASISPSTWGYDEIKKSLVLQLFGGVQKERPEGGKTRGDIHILLIGDPGVAKSVLLGFMASISPKGRYVVGKSASGAGLTATVVKDEYMKGWSLEAGAMVLSNKGLVCIDELEKMDPNDRSAMHEAMEQQTVTISKANVQASLKAETSVLAAANPKFGRFDPGMPIPQQIDLPPTLINRFDLMFVLRDLPNKEKDEQIALHVLRTHQEDVHETLLDKNIFRKYVAHAKQKIKPKISDEASTEIRRFYVDLRNRPMAAEKATIPISARQLTALIRLAEASAKLKLSNVVTVDDARIAIDLIKYYMMQVGYDEKEGVFDVDRISSRFSSSQRNKIFLVRETITALESRMGKQIPLEELEKELEDKMTKAELDEAITKLQISGDIFTPKRGIIQKTDYN